MTATARAALAAHLARTIPASTPAPAPAVAITHWALAARTS